MKRLQIKVDDLTLRRLLAELKRRNRGRVPKGGLSKVVAQAIGAWLEVNEKALLPSHVAKKRNELSPENSGIWITSINRRPTDWEREETEKLHERVSSRW